MNDTKIITVGGVVRSIGKVLVDHPGATEFVFRRETLQELLAQAPAGLRDEFAKAALTGFLSCSSVNFDTAGDYAAKAYEVADAMLKAREGK